MPRKTGSQVRHTECDWRDVGAAAAACEERFQVSVRLSIEVWPNDPIIGDLTIHVVVKDTLWPNEGAELLNSHRRYWRGGRRSIQGEALILLTDTYRKLEGLEVQLGNLREDMPSVLRPRRRQVPQ